jgi:hypothetical protein
VWISTLGNTNGKHRAAISETRLHPPRRRPDSFASFENDRSAHRATHCARAAGAG